MDELKLQAKQQISLRSVASGSSLSKADSALVDAYLKDAAREGSLIDRSSVVFESGAGYQVLHGPETGITSLTSQKATAGSEVVAERVAIEGGELDRSAAGPKTAVGLGYAPHESIAVNNCTWINGDSASGHNRTRWCWKKTQMLEDGDTAKEFWFYKHSSTAWPNTNSTVDWYIRGMTVQSTPGVSSRDRIIGGSGEYAPASSITGDSCTTANLSVGTGPITVGFSTPICGRSDPSANGIEGYYQVKYTTGAFGEGGASRSTALHIGVATNNQTPYWSDYNVTTYCHYTHADCDNVYD